MALSRTPRLLLRLALLAFSLLGISSCAPPAHRAFYYWKTAQGPSVDEIALADRVGADRLYVRIFDVEPTGEGSPALLATSAERESWTAGGKRELIPVVYIANEALLSATFQPTNAARSLLEAVARMWGPDGPPWRELQIDCDWTGSTRDAYFALLALLSRGLRVQGRTLSATIRLHQVKYRAFAGVPPVDRGMLMAYNLLPPNAAGEKSAILDDSELAKYLAAVNSYPLPLDIALPVFSWVVQWEGERLIGLIDDPSAAARLSGPGFRSFGNHRYEAIARCSLAGRSVESGDVFVIDNPGAQTASRAAAMLQSVLRRETRSVAIFHLDADALGSFTGGDYGKIEAIYGALRARRGCGIPASRMRSRPLRGRGCICRSRSAGLFLMVRS
jgi:hypothetical protein